MKKTGLLNAEISSLIARMGHTDCLAIADAGLPIPETTERIDLALTAGIPSFLETLDAVLSEFQVEKIFLAEEIQAKNATLLAAIRQRFPQTPIVFISHEALKKELPHCKGVIRSGECTPFANVLLQSGVVF